MTTSFGGSEGSSPAALAALATAPLVLLDGVRAASSSASPVRVGLVSPFLLPLVFLVGVSTASDASDSLDVDLVRCLVGVLGIAPSLTSSVGLGDFFCVPLLDGVLLTETLLSSDCLSAGLTERELDLVTLAESVSRRSSDALVLRDDRVGGTSWEVVLTGLVSRDLLRFGEGCEVKYLQVVLHGNYDGRNFDFMDSSLWRKHMCVMSFQCGT